MAEFSNEYLQQNAYIDPGYDFDRLSTTGDIMPATAPIDIAPPDISLPSPPGSAANQIELQELDVERDILPNQDSLTNKTGGGRYLIIGRPGSGKSILMKDILYYKRNFIPVVSVVSTTEKFNNFYEGFVPKLFVHDAYRPDIVTDFVNHQAKVMQKVDYNSSYAALIMDDCAADSKIVNSKELENVLKNGRHMNILFIMAVQYVLDMKPAMRACFDGVFILRNSVKAERQKIYDNYATVIKTFGEFERVMDEKTENFGAIFIDYRANSNDWRDCVKVYKAEERENFQSCAPAVRRFSIDRTA